MDQVIQVAKNQHVQWRNSAIPKSAVGERTKLSSKIHHDWQASFQCGTIKVEVPVGDKRREKIDVIDLKRMFAYEMKVSGKNLKHEVFKDIMKVLMYNLNHPKQPIKHFYFLSEKSAIESLERNFDKQLKKSLEKYYNFCIFFEGLG